MIMKAIRKSFNSAFQTLYTLHLDLHHAAIFKGPYIQTSPTRNNGRPFVLDIIRIDKLVGWLPPDVPFNIQWWKKEALLLVTRRPLEPLEERVSQKWPRQDREVKKCCYTLMGNNEPLHPRMKLVVFMWMSILKCFVNRPRTWRQ